MLGRTLERGTLILLGGMIGAGKTTFAQGIGRGLRVTSDMLSPTFTLVSEHDGLDTEDRPLRIYHIDLYRVEDSGDLFSFGIEEYLDDPDSVTVIEWPERARAVLPDEHILVDLGDIADTKRRITFEPRGERYRPTIEGLKREVAGVRG